MLKKAKEMSQLVQEEKAESGHVRVTKLPIGYSVIVALTGLPIGYSVIVALTGLPIGYSVIVALTSLLSMIKICSFISV